MSHDYFSFLTKRIPIDISHFLVSLCKTHPNTSHSQYVKTKHILIYCVCIILSFNQGFLVSNYHTYYRIVYLHIWKWCTKIQRKKNLFNIFQSGYYLVSTHHTQLHFLACSISLSLLWLQSSWISWWHFSLPIPHHYC